MKTLIIYFFLLPLLLAVVLLALLVQYASYLRSVKQPKLDAYKEEHPEC